MNRPEGLSPAYGSLMSPNIAPSLRFAWTPPHVQTRAIIRIYEELSGSLGKLLYTHNENTGRTIVPCSDINFTFTDKKRYQWTVTTYSDSTASDTSAVQSFEYSSYVPGEELQLAVLDKIGDKVTRDTYFKTLKQNLTRFANGFPQYKNGFIAIINDLFTGRVAPSKEDFTNLQELLKRFGELQGIQYTPTKEIRPTDPTEKLDGRNIGEAEHGYTQGWVASNTPKLAVIDQVSDSLGISDLEHISTYLEMLSNIPPLPVKKIDPFFPNADMYQIDYLRYLHDGIEDNTVELSWSASPRPVASVLWNLGLDNSPDIWCYVVDFIYGPNERYKSSLIFRREAVERDNNIFIPLDFAIENGKLNLMNQTISLEIRTVDFYGNKSRRLRKSYTFTTSQKLPMGLDRYELQTVAVPMHNSNHDNGYWSTYYQGKNTSTTHVLQVEERKIWYRVKAIDISGLESNWKEVGPITFDPLQPPGPVKNVRFEGTEQWYTTMRWDPTPRAEYYIYKHTMHPAEMNNGGGTAAWIDGFQPETTYTTWVRACNRKGCGPWTETPFRTKDKPIQTITYDSHHCHAYNWTTHRWRPQEGYNHTRGYYGGGASGHWASMYYFRENDIRSNLAGKKIINAYFRVKRIEGGTAPAHQGRLLQFYTHNHTRDFGGYVGDRVGWSGNNWSSYIPSWDTALEVGQTKTIPIPVEYVQRIVNWQAQGICIYDAWGGGFCYMNNFAQLVVQYKD
ncbi:virion structural protein_gp084 [Bacillus phage vB_BceM_WH1]|nr:virion structural protein_gp084 [Bacillus phage vB_BceM_WH1]